MTWARDLLTHSCQLASFCQSVLKCFATHTRYADMGICQCTCCGRALENALLHPQDVGMSHVDFARCGVQGIKAWRVGGGGIRAWRMRHKKRRKGGSQPSLLSIGRSFSVAALGRRMVLPVRIISLPHFSNTGSIPHHNNAPESPTYTVRLPQTYFRKY